MKKLVNGKVIDINNIDLFERAAEDLIIDRVLPNLVSDNSMLGYTEEIQECISLYNTFYKALPFPLYGVDSDLKYCSAGLYIKKHTGSKYRMWVDHGLYICTNLSTKMTVGFVNNTWGVVVPEEIKEDNIIIEQFANEVGFEDFVYVAASMVNDENTANYYLKNMPEFVNACGGQPMVMRWELSNILQFGMIHDKINFQFNKILDLNKGIEYMLDIFTAGSRETKDEHLTFSLINNSLESKHKTVKVYGYELYKKKLTAETAGEDKTKTAELYGINSLFCVLCNLKNLLNYTKVPDFRGFIADGNLVFEIAGRVFVAKSDRYVDAEEIARGVELYSYNRNILYLIKNKEVAPGVNKEIIYSYTLTNKSLRLCKIRFVKN